MSDRQQKRPKPRLIHGLAVRAMHWVNAAAVLVLIPSGWEIYNAAPLYAMTFPRSLTLGASLTGALLWHFAFMWLLVLNGSVYLAYRIALRRGSPSLLPLSARGFAVDLWAALCSRLNHGYGTYNHVQRAFYLGVWVLLALSVLSGIALWKPVQLQTLTDLVGGYEAARRVHFWSMAGIVAFLAIHIIMVALVPKTLLAIVLGVAVSGRPRTEVLHEQESTSNLARP